MSKNMIVTQEEIVCMNALRNMGKSNKEIADSLTRSLQTVDTYIGKDRVIVTSKEKHEQAYERFVRVCEMYFIEKKTREEIAELCGLTKSTVRAMVTHSTRPYKDWLVVWEKKNADRIPKPNAFKENVFEEIELLPSQKQQARLEEQEKVIDLLIGITNKLDEQKEVTKSLEAIVSKLDELLTIWRN